MALAGTQQSSFNSRQRSIRILGANGRFGGHARLVTSWTTLILLKVLRKPVDEVLTCTENADGPLFTRRLQTFLDQLGPVLDGATRDQHLLVYLDEAHLHQ